MPHTIIRRFAALLVAVSCHCINANAATETKLEFEPVQTQFIAALGDPAAGAGKGAESWGLWRKDPGPRGVWLRFFPLLKAAGGHAPARWQFDQQDWWLDENGLIMEKPEFPVPAGKYLVTGGREVTTILTVHPQDDQGVQHWDLAHGATLYDVTHMPCRSARYTPLASATDSESCSPANADQSHFKVAPGSLMPAVPGCRKQDYSVLIVIGVAKDS